MNEEAVVLLLNLRLLIIRARGEKSSRTIPMLGFTKYPIPGYKSSGIKEARDKNSVKVGKSHFDKNQLTTKIFNR